MLLGKQKLDILLLERLKLLSVSSKVVPVFSLTLVLVSACGRGGNGWRDSQKLCWTSCTIVHPQAVFPLCKSQSSCAWWPRKGELTPSEGLEASAKSRIKKVFPFLRAQGCWTHTLCAKAACALPHTGSHHVQVTGNQWGGNWKCQLRPAELREGLGYSQHAVFNSFSGCFPVAGVMPARVGAAFPAQCPCAGSLSEHWESRLTGEPGVGPAPVFGWQPGYWCQWCAGTLLAVLEWVLKEDMLLAWRISGVDLCIT